MTHSRAEPPLPRRAPGADAADRALWRRSRETEMPADEAALLLELAAFAEYRLDEDEAERLTELVTLDPALAGDVAVARALAGRALAGPDLDPIIARAAALVGPEPVSAAPASRRAVVAFPEARSRWRAAAGWSSLAAAIAMASWLGFALGSDAYLAIGQLGQSAEDSSLHELIDPATAGAGFRAMSEGGTT